MSTWQAKPGFISSANAGHPSRADIILPKKEVQVASFEHEKLRDRDIILWGQSDR